MCIRDRFPKAVYEMAFPGIEKMPIRNAFPYFKSFLSCSEGIVSVDFVLRDLTPVMRIHYVKSMWNDEKLWKEIFQAEKWTLRMADGTFKEADPRLKFTNPGKTVTAVSYTHLDVYKRQGAGTQPLPQAGRRGHCERRIRPICGYQ